MHSFAYYASDFEYYCSSFDSVVSGSMRRVGGLRTIKQREKKSGEPSAS